MQQEKIINVLLDYMERLPLIDSHEHFITESAHLEKEYNFFHLLIPYIQYDLYSAGMPKEWLCHPPSGDKEIEQYWRVISPLWKYVKNGSYARATLLGMEKFWGINDITDENYKELGQIINNTRVEGHYQKVLLEECNIKYILNQDGFFRTSFPDYPYMKGAYVFARKVLPELIKEYIRENNGKVTFTDYCEHIKAELKKAKEDGAVLIKFGTQCFLEHPNREKAAEEFEALKKNQCNNAKHLMIYLSEEALKYMEETDLVAAVHTGVWGDVTYRSPEFLFPVLERFPNVSFDIYHMGMPYVRECGFLGKNYQNGYLNLCWSHIVSPEMTVNTLNEWLDFVPSNKIFGFGGDYNTNPENIWGHLQIARENLAEVFSRKILKGLIDLDTAKYTIKSWLYDNPAGVYKLK